MDTKALIFMALLYTCFREHRKSRAFYEVMKCFVIIPVANLSLFLFAWSVSHSKECEL